MNKKQERDMRRRLLSRMPNNNNTKTMPHTAKALSIQYGRSPDL